MKLRYLLVALLGMQTLHGQMHEIGLHLNATNYIGEVGSTTYVDPNPKKLGYGLFYKRNFTTRYAVRAELGFAKFTANDLNASDPGRKTREYSFENKLAYGSAIFEFNYLDFDLSSFEYTWTPYVFLGIGYHNHDDLFFDMRLTGAQEAQSEHKASSWGIPFGVGVKTKLTPFLVLGAEIKALYSFSDNLDGSFPTFGTVNNDRFNTRLSNDWVLFSGVTLSYSFGRPPCFCN